MMEGLKEGMTTLSLIFLFRVFPPPVVTGKQGSYQFLSRPMFFILYGLQLLLHEKGHSKLSKLYFTGNQTAFGKKELR